MENTSILIEYAFFVALVVTAIGFRNTVWFISIGYAFSMAVMALMLFSFYFQHFQDYNLVHAGLILAWGLRLGFYLSRRELNKNYQTATTESRGIFRLSIFAKVAIWLLVSVLYTSMFSPAILALRGIVRFGKYSMFVIWLGLAIMTMGLIIESLADRQKSKFKNQYPNRFCDIGLYKWVRFPNYFGEILFWTGNQIVAISFLVFWWEWLMVFSGWILLVSVMINSSKRLERKQELRYGDDPDYNIYKVSVPVLFPWLPIFSLNSNRNEII